MGFGRKNLMECENDVNKMSNVNEVVTVEGVSFEIRPKWQNTENNIDKYKLTPEKQLEKKLQRVSDNYKKASLEYREYLKSLRTDSILFRNLCRSVSPLKSSCKDKTKDDIKRARSLSRKGSIRFDLENKRNEKTGEKQGNNLISRQSRSAPPINRNKEDVQEINRYDKECDNFEKRGHRKIDVYLTNLTLSASIERYTRRLYNICKILDSDFGEDDQNYGENYDYDEFDSDSNDEIINNKRTVIGNSTSPNSGAKRNINNANGNINAKLNDSKIQHENQSQIMEETLNETASKWSRRLRNNNLKEAYSSDLGQKNRENSLTGISKATYARMSLKQIVSKLNLEDEGNNQSLFERGRSEIRKKSSTCQETGYYDRRVNKNKENSFANVIVTSENVSKQPFISLFNIQS
ncbi:hypothetical protein FG379_003256 [Cryptosporidium bovis]|uniref:uncharacterized protein n=1 Tax=Cryptosporidium bovis TaxID=310047 RepID=UPI003519DC5B|nr:hypothetical protein FG379_003256 [Cryptosporidium bovis]